MSKIEEGKTRQPQTVEAQLNRIMEDIMPVGAPFITEETAKLLGEHLNVNAHIQCDDEGTETSYERGLRMATEYFEYLRTDDEQNKDSLLSVIEDWLSKNYKCSSNTHSFMDASSVGMATVIAAYHLQCGPEFLDRLRSLQPEKFKKALESTKSKLNSKKTSIISRVRNNYKIPVSQVFFNSCLSRFTRSQAPTYLGQVVEDGAITMFKVVDHLWQDLQPGQTGR